MEDESDSEAHAPELNDLPPSHRFYSPQTEGNLHTQLGTYRIVNKHGGLGILNDRARLAYAINEIAANNLNPGKLYLLKPIWNKKLIQRPPHPIPDLLFSTSYVWTEESRDAFLALTPTQRLRAMTASLSDHDPGHLVLPIFVFQNSTTPCVRVDARLKVKPPKFPDKGVWICTRTEPVRAGMVEDVVKIGIIVGPYDEKGKRVGWFSRRLDMGCENHRTYLSQAEVDGQDQALSIYQWLLKTRLLCPVLQLEQWEKVVKMVDDIIEKEKKADQEAKEKKAEYEEVVKLLEKAMEGAEAEAEAAVEAEAGAGAEAEAGAGAEAEVEVNIIVQPD